MTDARGQKQLLGHPYGLFVLFFTEMWERASYYGMRALLTLYMTGSVMQPGLGFPDSKATKIYGLYTMLVYLMGIPGGFLADRFIGHRRAVFIGGVIIANGHFPQASPRLPRRLLRPPPRRVPRRRPPRRPPSPLGPPRPAVLLSRATAHHPRHRPSEDDE